MQQAQNIVLTAKNVVQENDFVGKILKNDQIERLYYPEGWNVGMFCKWLKLISDKSFWSWLLIKASQHACFFVILEWTKCPNKAHKKCPAEFLIFVALYLILSLRKEDFHGQVFYYQGKKMWCFICLLSSWSFLTWETTRKPWSRFLILDVSINDSEFVLLNLWNGNTRKGTN